MRVFSQKKGLSFYVVLAAASLFFTLLLPFVGEEAVYTISAYEMWFHHHYLINTLYGYFYGRPPLLNWLIIPLTKTLGWEHVLLASRLISASATTLVVFLTFWFVQRITKNRHFSLLCAAIYLTGDLLLFRGWLAYTDPLLSLFIFASIVFLWVGVDEKRNGFLLLAIIALGAGFLTKALSPYWFYGAAGLVLLIAHDNRQFLLRPASIVIHLLALTVPFLWNHLSDPRYLHTMWQEATNTAFSPSIGKYIYQVAITQPGMLLLRLAPFSLVALFYYFKKVRKQSNAEFRSIIQITFWIALLNFAACWFALRWPEARYYMPAFPLMAMCMAYVIWNAGAKALKITGYLLLGTLIFKMVYVGVMYYQYKYLEPNYRVEAQEILNLVGNQSIYVDKYTCQAAPVLKVANYINLLRFPKPPLEYQPDDYWQNALLDTINIFPLPHRYPPLLHWNNAFMLGQLRTDRDTVVKQYAKGKRIVYLFCRGLACLK